ncbi:MAG: helix-turn-helix protein [Frankiales bacterium]|nr:helix-turn-helix protein [Frankiales bacterium]
MTNKQMANPEVRRTFEEELLYGEVSDNFEALLQDLKISKKELAGRLGVSQGRVSQILSGEENLTLRTVGALAWALGLRANVTLEPLVDRAGTPAQDDPSAPGWLRKAQMRHCSVQFRPIQMPSRRPSFRPGLVVSPNGDPRRVA